ncbi:MAG TPA: Gfo/Idh/MocA family oxidoreductase [Flavisolibacter sp.]|nr:Gfo/Idh/MocA family oxidoreductase [Flavisolibacter sp.]
MYKFAIIGCGRIAYRHAEHILRVGQLVAVCDIDKTKADAFAKQYDAKAFYSIDDLLKSSEHVDIVSVCTPNGFHAEHAIKSLQARKHVLCEKPMCITSVAAWQMADTAHFFRKKLFVVKQNRFNPPIQLVKKDLEANKYGTIYSFQINCFWNRSQGYYTGDWRGTKELDGGTLYTQFSHFIDVLYWFLGDVEEVKGFKENYTHHKHVEIEDTGVVTLKMKSGAIGTLNFTVNSYQHNQEGSFTLFGEKGSVKIGGQYLNTLEWYETETGETPSLANPVPANHYGHYQGSMSNHDKVYEALVASLNSNGSNGSLLEARDAIKTIEIIEKIYKALE